MIRRIHSFLVTRYCYESSYTLPDVAPDYDSADEMEIENDAMQEENIEGFSEGEDVSQHSQDQL